MTTYTPLLGAELVLAAGTTLPLALDPAYEVGLLVDTGELHVAGEPLARHELGFLEPGSAGSSSTALAEPACCCSAARPSASRS